ncbi:MAG: 3-oxoacyl-[acyl-carrier-protein] reductase [Candidatus Marinimicrobia bacterium]|jgi:3-oxoacyl-[acyl-carrier protein] reductase|nr:3-oxoacyl-[acyl-carrier-protein] reductase [Candidatus Neomarinimicrobiota bacterium]
MNNTNLKNKVAIVTGASRGIGLEIAKIFYENGAKIVITDIDDKTLSIVNKEFDDSKNILSIVSDVSISDSVTNMIKTTIEKFNKIDILVNCAGITRDNLIIRMKENDWDNVINTNLKSVFLTSKIAGRYMMKEKSGNIINISSVVGITGNAGQTNYSASKAGIIGMTKSLAKEFATRNIKVNAIAPGFIDTTMTKNLKEDAKEQLIDAILLKRLGTTKDIANAALFLASSLSDYITGQTLVVDGGMIT